MFSFDEHIRYWGARAIFKGWSDNYRIDLLPDRQTGEDVNQPFLGWLNNRALPWLREEVKALCTDKAELVEFQEFKYVLKANTNGSCGYLYIGAAELPVTKGEPRLNQTSGDLEDVHLVLGQKYVFNGDIPAVGTRGLVRINQCGHGTVVGYQDTKYGPDDEGDYRLLNLLVKLDDPPEWWMRQTRQHDFAKFLTHGTGYSWLKPRHQEAMDAALVEGERQTFRTSEGLARLAPSQLFRREFLQDYRKWDAEYSFPPALIWDGDFAPEGANRQRGQS